jgi:hypothetical protein
MRAEASNWKLKELSKDACNGEPRRCHQVAAIRSFVAEDWQEALVTSRKAAG